MKDAPLPQINRNRLAADLKGLLRVRYARTLKYRNRAGCVRATLGCFAVPLRLERPRGGGVENNRILGCYLINKGKLNRPRYYLTRQLNKIVSTYI